MSRVISLGGGNEGVGHALVEGAVICGSLKSWWMTGEKFDPIYDCQKCKKKLNKMFGLYL